MHGLNFLKPVWFILFFCVLFNSCSFFYKDPVVLQINEKKWTATAFSKRLAQKINSFSSEQKIPYDFLENIKTQLIGDLLMEYLVQKRAKEYFIVISEQEWQHTLQKIQNSYSSKEVFDLYLKRQKVNRKTWEKSVYSTLLHKKVVQHIGSTAKKPSPKELKSYYQNHLNLFKKTSSLLIYHIFHKEKQKALQAREALKKNHSLMRSQKLTSGQKTELPKGERQWVEKGNFTLFDQAFSLKKNEISPIWLSPHGYHVIQLIDKKPAHIIPYKTALPRIQKILMDQRKKALWTKWLDTESQKVKVWTNKKALAKIKTMPL